ncbi:kinase-like domain-containing protein [Mycena galericulata]|nr:kinase-like domain-containing protein [Mycena galericulata]
MTSSEVVVARLLPSESAAWMSYHGEQQAAKLETVPFLALMIKGSFSLAGNLFVIDTEECKPPAGYRRFALNGIDKMLSLTAGCPAERTTYVHNYPIPFLSRASVVGAPGLEPRSHHTFCARVVEDAVHYPTRTLPAKLERMMPPNGLSFTFTSPNGFLPDGGCRIYEELAAYESIAADFCWRGVDATIRWVRRVRKHQVTSLMPAVNFEGGSRGLAAAIELADMTVPVNGVEVAASDDNDDNDDDDEDYMVRFGWMLHQAPPVPEEALAAATAPVPAGKIKVILFDPRDTLFDFSGAARAAISRLGTDLSAVLETACLTSRESPGASPAATLRTALARVAGEDTSPTAIWEAAEKMLSPPVHADARDAVEHLQRSGYQVCQLPDVFCSTESLPVPTAGVSAPLTLCDHADNLAEAFDWAKTAFAMPALQESEMLIVTGSLYRVVEAANARQPGFPTALVLNAGAVEGDFRLPGLEATVAVQTLQDLHAFLGSSRDERAAESTEPGGLRLFRVGGHYQCVEPIGFGAFASVWRAIHVLTGQQVAVKVENAQARRLMTVPYEAQVYRCLAPHGGIPRLHWAGSAGDARVLVLDLLGPTLEELRRFCRGTLSIQTVCVVAQEMLTTIAHAHWRGIVLRDVTPANFAVGMDEGIYMIDFGLAKLFVDPRRMTHIPPRQGLAHIGTPVFASHRAHRGEEQSRRDDIEALGNCLVYLHKGRLPWEAGEGDLEVKLRALADSAPLFSKWFEHCHSLGFEDQPNYRQLWELLDEPWDPDGDYDWMMRAGSGRGTLLPHEYRLEAAEGAAGAWL